MLVTSNRFPRRLTAAMMIAGAGAVTSSVFAGDHPAGSPFLVLPETDLVERSPAYTYANMTNEQALAELDRRGILYMHTSAQGVRAPVRLTARLHGVNFHSALAPDVRVESAFEILDARLALALDDFAALLERHDVIEVVHYTMYRPDGSVMSAPDDISGAANSCTRAMPSYAKVPRQRSKRAELHPTDKRSRSEHPPVRGHAKPSRITCAAPGTRHPAGLAIDVGAFRKTDGTWLNVARHFGGRVGDKTCGEGVHIADQSEARELRSIVCEAADLKLFTYALTPDYNAAHHDHFHLEIKPAVRWFLYH